MESAMLYNLPILYGMYALLAALQCAFPQHYYLASLGILTFLPWSYDTPWSILLILFWVASAIHYLLMSLLQTVSFSLANRSWQWWSTTWVVIGIVLPLCLGMVLWKDSWTVFGLASCMVYCAGVVAVILTCLWMVGQSTTTTHVHNKKNCGSGGGVGLAALILLTAPGILAGSFTLLMWEQQVDSRSWWLWARLVMPALVMAMCQKGLATRRITTPTTIASTGTRHQSSILYWTRGFLLVLIILGTKGPRVLGHGNSFRVAHLVMAVVMTECLLHTVTLVDLYIPLFRRIPDSKQQ